MNSRHCISALTGELIVTQYYDVLINRNDGPNSMMNVPNNRRPQLLFGTTIIIAYD